MSYRELDQYAAADIRKIVTRVLNDLGNPEPPLKLKDVRELLKLDLNYYSKTDLTAFNEFTHKIKVAGKELLKKPASMIEIVKKAGLRALLFFEDNRILLDDSIPTPKQRHTEAHEISHNITPWHKDFLHGDNNLTLSRECENVIETEANYGAGQLLFLMDKFSRDAKGLDFSWKSIRVLKERYNNTLTTTLWHFVEEKHPTLPVVGLISLHPRHESLRGSVDDGKKWKHFMCSRGFLTQFPHLTGDDIYKIISGYATFSKGGPAVGGAMVPIMDAANDIWEFQFESFFNTHAPLLTFGIIQRKLPKVYAT